MKLTRKSLVALLTVLAMLVTLCSVNVPTEAASTKQNVTMFVGEKLQVHAILGTIKKVSSSKKKVCSAKKKSGNALLTAKKTGKAKIKIKTSGKTFTYNVTVKKNPFKFVAKPMKNGVCVEVKNTSSTYFEDVRIQATFCDAAGNAVNQSSGYVWDLGKKQSGFKDFTTYDKTVDFSKTRFSVISWTRNINKNYKNYGSKTNISVVEEPSTYGKKIKTRAASNYSGDGHISVAQDIICYDASGQIIAVYNDTCYLNKTKSVETSYGRTLPSDCARYSVVSKRACLITYK